MPQEKTTHKNNNKKLYLILAVILLLLVAVPVLSFVIIKNSQKYKTSSRATNVVNPSITSLNENIRDYLNNPEKRESSGHLEDLLNIRKSLLESALNDTDNLTDQTLASLLLTEEEVAGIPDELKGLVERYQSNMNGKTEVYITDNFEEGKSSISYGLTTDEGNYDILIPGHSTEPLLPGNTDVSFPRVPVFENKILLSSGYREGASFGTPPDIQRKGDVRYAVILVNFEDDKSEPKNKKEIYDIIFNRNNPTSVASYYNEVSYGQFNIVGSEDDILGWYTIKKNSDKCDLDKWAEAAEAKTKDTDLNKLSEKGPNRIYIFPRNEECVLKNTNATSIMGSNIVNMMIYEPLPKKISQSISHEIGHNLGLFHAYAFNNGLTDFFDTMNLWDHDYYGHFNSYFKQYLGWIPLYEAKESAIYTLAPLESKSEKPQVIRVPIKSILPIIMDYYIEYRRPVGFDKFTPLFKDTSNNPGGIQIRQTYSLNSLHFVRALFNIYSFSTRLIDVAPETYNYYDDAFLSDGKYFYDYTNKILITQISHDENQAVVNIQFDAPEPTPQPTITPVSLNCSFPYSASNGECVQGHFDLILRCINGEFQHSPSCGYPIYDYARRCDSSTDGKCVSPIYRCQNEVLVPDNTCPPLPTPEPSRTSELENPEQSPNL